MNTIAIDRSIVWGLATLADVDPGDGIALKSSFSSCQSACGRLHSRPVADYLRIPHLEGLPMSGVMVDPTLGTEELPAELADALTEQARGELLGSELSPNAIANAFVRLRIDEERLRAIAGSGHHLPTRRHLLLESGKEKIAHAVSVLRACHYDFDPVHDMVALPGLHGINLTLPGDRLRVFLDENPELVSAVIPDAETQPVPCEEERSAPEVLTFRSQFAKNEAEDLVAAIGEAGATAEDDPLAIIEIDQLHSRNHYGEGGVVAIVDSGVDVSIKSLRTPNKVRAFRQFDRHGRVTGEYQASDAGCHGTKLCSLVAGERGVAPKSQLIVLRVLDGTCKKEIGTTKQLLGGLEWLVSNANRLAVDSVAVNISITFKSRSPSQAKAFDELFQLMRGLGLEPICPSGNFGSENTFLGCVANYVGAIDSDRRIWGKSGRCAEQMIPHIVCPGVNIRCDQPIDVRLENLSQACYTGTSFAAAFFSGSVCVLQRATQKKATECVKACYDTAMRPSGVEDSAYGQGILAANAACQRLRRG